MLSHLPTQALIVVCSGINANKYVNASGAANQAKDEKQTLGKVHEDDGYNNGSFSHGGKVLQLHGCDGTTTLLLGYSLFPCI